MDLKEFIKETLSQIVDGVAEAKSASTGKHVTIAPHWLETRDVSISFVRDGSVDFPTYEVDFQVELTVDESKSGNKGIKVGFAGLSAGGVDNKESSNRSSTLIKFSVPILWRPSEDFYKPSTPIVA